ncbi:YigZ family protein [bacterium]|nr:YigZ family protein [bacterium]
MDAYTTVAGRSTAELEERASRFIATLDHVTSEQEARALVDEVRGANPLARHNVYAWSLRLGGERRSDDGEPQGTSGPPVLDVLRGSGLRDVCCVVTRYFGGTLLGTGGLVRAYSGVARMAVASARLVRVSRCVDVSVRVGYPLYERVARLAADLGAKVLDTRFADAVELDLRMLDGTQQPLLDALREVGRGEVVPRVSDPIDAVF